MSVMRARWKAAMIDRMMSYEEFRGLKWLDDLPDSVMQRILSFLPMKDAIVTCQVLKKWQYLWTSIPNLDFQEGDDSAKRELFFNFVDRVLLLHDFPGIESFSLQCNVDDDASRIKSWICALARHNIQRLSLDLSHINDEAFMMPQYLFHSKSLTFLELVMPCTLKLPSFARFSNLKILHLSHIVFFDSCTSEQLFSSPLLEELSLKYCDCRSSMGVDISAPKLWSLVIHEPEEDCSSCLPKRFGIKIVGSSLKFFEYHGKFWLINCKLDVTSSMVEACIFIPNHVDRSQEVGSHFWQLLSKLHNVKSFKLSSGALEVLTRFVNLLPVFSNLTNLRIDLEVMDCDCEALWKILEYSPHLETLEFIKGIGLSCKEENPILDPAPLCFLSHLKNIKVGQFDGTWQELYVVKHLLNRAEVLDNMVISFSQRLTMPGNVQKKVRELLLDFSKKSGSCELLLT